MERVVTVASVLILAVPVVGALVIGLGCLVEMIRPPRVRRPPARMRREEIEYHLWLGEQRAAGRR